MAHEEGIVTKVSSAGTAWVLTTRSGACESCSSRSMCQVVGGGGSKDAEVTAINSVNARPGDRIILSFETGSLIKATFLVYVFPVVSLLIGALIGEAYAPVLQMNPSAMAAIVGFIFFGIALIFNRFMGNQLASKDSYRPQITRILKRPIEKEVASDQKT